MPGDARGLPDFAKISLPQLASGGDPQLRVDAAQVRIDRTRAQEDLARGFLAGGPGRDETGDLQFLGGEQLGAGRAPVSPSRRLPGAGRGRVPPRGGRQAARRGPAQPEGAPGTAVALAGGAAILRTAADRACRWLAPVRRARLRSCIQSAEAARSVRSRSTRL